MGGGTGYRLEVEFEPGHVRQSAVNPTLVLENVSRKCWLTSLVSVAWRNSCLKIAEQQSTPWPILTRTPLGSLFWKTAIPEKSLKGVDRTQKSFMFSLYFMFYRIFQPGKMYYMILNMVISGHICHCYYNQTSFWENRCVIQCFWECSSLLWNQVVFPSGVSFVSEVDGPDRERVALPRHLQCSDRGVWRISCTSWLIRQLKHKHQPA